MVRVGLLGGTFNPPHFGHLVAAQEAAWQLDLDRVIFLPTSQNPLKPALQDVSAEDRCHMVQLAIADNPRFTLSTLDLTRPSPSYTVDVLRALKTRCEPDTRLYFIGGADLLQELPAWHEPQEVLRLAQLVAVNRPGWPIPDVSAVTKRLGVEEDRILMLVVPGVDVSSTMLRARVRLGQPIHYLTPPSVEAYIVGHGLYTRPR